MDLELGITVDTFRGIPIIPLNIWDQYIKGDFDNGTTYHLPNRAIYTTLSALGVGFDIIPDKSGVVKTWYDENTKYQKIRGAFMIDAKTGFDDLISVAY